MNRRKFIEDLIKAGGAMTVSGVVLNELLTEDKGPFVARGNINFTNNLVSDPNAEFTITYNKKTRTIEIEGNGDNGIRIEDLYRYIRDEWEDGDEPYEFPIKKSG